jgi:hypothetical protein
MKKTTAKSRKDGATAGEAALNGDAGRIHPVIIYPFHASDDLSDLKALYELVARLDGDKKRYARPITVIDRKTHYACEKDKNYQSFRKDTVARHSEIQDSWSVDTCQMWYSGLGTAFERGAENDVYWLIPGDFNYGTHHGHEVLGRLHDLPEIILELNQDICIGEIATDHSNSKQLIDTYSTFALMYNWFPAEAAEIRQFTERPRSEFFAVRHDFLRMVLGQRWYAYEQTVVMLLHAVFDQRRISRFFVGNISDMPTGKESLAHALQQVDRTERVLKSLWRQHNHPESGWTEKYQALELQSDQVRRTAQTILHNLLG